MMSVLLLGFGEQKGEEAVDERKGRCWENGKGKFKNVAGFQKREDRSR